MRLRNLLVARLLLARRQPPCIAPVLVAPRVEGKSDEGVLCCGSIMCESCMYSHGHGIAGQGGGLWQQDRRRRLLILRLLYAQRQRYHPARGLSQVAGQSEARLAPEARIDRSARFP
jgi:hypothetical protein